MDAKVPDIETREDIKTHAGDTVLVRGTYVEIDVRKRKTEPPVYAGHAAVRLGDGTLVLLGPPGNAVAIRSEKERDELRDEEVVASGFLNAICPAGPGASLQVPCLYPFLYVVTPEIHTLLHDD